MATQASFLDVSSFIMEEAALERYTPVAPLPSSTPFLALYDSEDAGLADPRAEQMLLFLNELYDDEFDEVLAELADEAAALYESHFPYEQEDPHTNGYHAGRLLTKHFAPVAAEAETMFRSLAAELNRRGDVGLTEGEVETLVDQYRPSVELSPSFEGLLGALKRVAKKGFSLAKQGIKAVGSLGLSAVLNRLPALVQPLIQRIVESAINKLPPHLQSHARALRDKLPFLKEWEEEGDPAGEAAASDVAEIQHEFNGRVARLLFARDEIEMEMEAARATSEERSTDAYPIAELERARGRFVENLGRLREGEDPTPAVQEFIPALLPVLKVGVRLAGRKRIVDFLAKLVGKLIQRFVGPQHTPALSRAMVDAGLRLLQLETGSPESEEAASRAAASRAAASAVVATVEETVRRVAALPEYVLEDSELFEGGALEAFEQAAAANLPPVLAEETYRKRPELRERRRGFWYRAKGRYKKRLGPGLTVRISPHRAAELETFGGDTVGEFLEEQLGLAPGEEVEARVHLFEAVPGTRLGDIVRGEELIPRVDGAYAHKVLHPLTREAAALLTGDPDLGREADADEAARGLEEGEAADPLAPQPGQRYYYLEIPGRRPLTVPAAGGRALVRRRTRSRFVFDFRANRLVVFLFLSEVRAQEVAVKIRQSAHMGAVMARLRRTVARGAALALAGKKGRVKLIHESAAPGRPAETFRRLPAAVPPVLRRRLTEWIVAALATQLKERAEEFKKAADETADGVTMVITLQNPPGFPQLRDALKAKAVSLASLNLPAGAPEADVKIVPGYRHE